jgi:hypothetical protein
VIRPFTRRNEAAPVPGKKKRPSEINWFDPAALRLHMAMLVGVAGCAAAAWFEWTRALRGHEIAWVYAFEWPLFAVMGVYVWWRLLHTGGAPADQVHEPRPWDGEPRSAPSVGDPGLAAWEAYLARLHAIDPPGTPPAR